MAPTTFQVAGMPVAELFEQIRSAGVPEAEASVLVGSWIFENIGRTQRSFNYATSFPAEDANCVATFARTFQHQDWVDGESVVQAERTTGEEGFNARFHHIESDLDSLAADVGKAYACLAAMRASLRTLLDELRNEINRLNRDIVALSDKGTRPPVFEGGRVTDFLDRGDFLGATKFLDKDVSVWRTSQGVMMLPAVLPTAIDPRTDPRARRPGDLAQFLEEQPNIREVFEQEEITKERFVERFGDERTPSGGLVRDLVDILPSNTRFETVEAMVNEVAEREAAAIRTRGGTGAAITAALGVGTDVTSVGEASVDRFETIPTKARQVLVGSGIDTMEKLANLDARATAELFQNQGVETSRGEIAAWAATAKTLTRIR